jgi:glycosyltransferase involved in cell wall biosynthesis
MTKISVAILTYNEEVNIKACLESVSWADEVILVDEKSGDATVKIAKKYTSKIFLVNHGSASGLTHDTMFHKHKQIALEKCTGDWIFQIDADERISPELAKEIKEAVDSPIYNGFQVPRRNIIFGKWIEHTGWYPDYQVKLFRKGKGRYACKTVHEQIEIDGEIGVLTQDLIHSHYISVSQFIDRMNRYTTNDANFILGKNESVSWTDAVKFPVDEFLKRFFFLEGYRDGLHGLVLSGFQALNRLVVFAKIWEKQGFWKKENPEFREEFLKTVKRSASDWAYWVAQTEKNDFKKLIYKATKKI